MKEHLNIYYLFLEDIMKNPMTREQKEQMWAVLLEAWKNKKPP